MYYLGNNGNLPVKPVTRRTTSARGQRRAVGRRYLQRPGRGPLNRRAYPTLGTPIPVSLAMQPGSFAGHALGASILDPISLTTSFVPSIAPMTAAPAAASSGGFLNTLLTGAINLWDSRPQILKDISLKVDPNVAMAAAQRMVSAGQVTQAVNYLRSVGINPSYLGVPVTGSMAGAAYQYGGFNMSSLTPYLPWIIGGGALLFIMPIVMGRK